MAFIASLASVTVCGSEEQADIQDLTEKVERYIGLLEKKRDAIDKFLNENYSKFNHTDFSAEEYVAHPINAYMLMKRTSVLWEMAKPGQIPQNIKQKTQNTNHKWQSQVISHKTQNTNDKSR